MASVIPLSCREFYKFFSVVNLHWLTSFRLLLMLPKTGLFWCFQLFLSVTIICSNPCCSERWKFTVNSCSVSFLFCNVTFVCLCLLKIYEGTRITPGTHLNYSLSFNNSDISSWVSLITLQIWRSKCYWFNWQRQKKSSRLINTFNQGVTESRCSYHRIYCVSPCLCSQGCRLITRWILLSLII